MELTVKDVVLFIVPQILLAPDTFTFCVLALVDFVALEATLAGVALAALASPGLQFLEFLPIDST